MTDYRGQLLAAMRGEARVGPGLAWAPRMDLWQIALSARGELPANFEGRDTAGIADELGVACHAVRGDYTLPRPPEDTVLRGFGLDNHPDYPYRVEVDAWPVDVERTQDRIRTVVQTDLGDAVFELEWTEQMRREGISLPFVRRYPVESLDDLAPVARLFETCRVIPTPERYRAFHERIGTRGVAVASGPVAASPLHLLLHDLAPMDRFFYLYADAREQLEAFGRRLEPFFDACLDALVACDAEVVFWGANYDRDLTWPPFLTTQIAPWLRRVADRLHGAGKLLLTHCDGENEGIGHVFGASGVDVVESVCPAPMTRLDATGLRDAFGEDVTIWGGVPSVALLPESMTDAAFEAYVDRLCEQIGDDRRWILGVSDNVPPDADMGRLERLGERFAGTPPVGA